MITTEEIVRAAKLTAHEFSRQMYRDPGEALSEANLAATQAAATYDPARGVAAATWISTTVRQHLASRLRREARRGQFRKHVPVESAPDPRKWDYRKFLTDLSADGRVMVELFANTPDHLLALVRGREGTAFQMKCLVKVVREYLTTTGWDRDRFWTAWDEVKEALQ